MNTQDNSTVTISFVESFESYAADSKMMGELKTRLEDTRKILEPVIRAHKIPVGDNKAWKEKRAIFFPLVQELEWPSEDGGADITDEEVKAEKKKAEARIVAWLGVIKTCLEYQILPTDKNADRLRKAKVWTALNGNGKMNPNWVDPNAPKIEPTATTPTTTPAATPTTTAPTTAPTTTPAKASTSAATPQKTAEVIHPLTSNVSSSDEPLSSREDFKVKMIHLFKNETFRDEYCAILALMLDVEKATLTRCMVQAADEIKV